MGWLGYIEVCEVDTEVAFLAQSIEACVLRSKGCRFNPGAAELLYYIKQHTWIR